jgi:hypothetical protein
MDFARWIHSGIPDGVDYAQSVFGNSGAEREID